MVARSAGVPGAAQLAGYRELALASHEQRKGAGVHSTPAPVAARRIRDAILDDAGPLKVGCDPLADGLLEAWSADPVALVGRAYERAE